MHSAPLYVHIIVLFCCTISVFFSCYTATMFWKTRLPRFFSCLLGSLLIGSAIWSSTFIGNEVLFYILMLALNLLFLKFSTHITWVENFLASINSVFHYMCIKGITVGAFSLLLRKNLYQIITVPTLALWVIAVTMLLILFSLFIYHNKKGLPQLKSLNSSYDEMKSVLFLHSALFIFMLFYSYNYYYNLDLVWFSFSQLLLSTLMLILYHLILHYGSRISYLLTNDIHQALVNSQLKSQLSQYESHQTELKKIEQFKHRFREVSLTIHQLIDEHHYDETKKVLEKDFLALLDLLPSRQEYSNSVLVNAFLLDWLHQCRHDHYKLEALLYIPENLLNQEKNLIYLLTEVRDIFMQLSSGIPSAVIKLATKNSRNRLIMNVSGPFRGIIEEMEEYPYFVTQKGMEIKSCYHRLVSLIDQIDGTLHWNTDNKACVFSLTLSFHTLQKN